jgi:hypothetical protein
MGMHVHAVVLPRSHDKGTESSTLGSAFLTGRFCLGVRLFALTGDAELSGESAMMGLVASASALAPSPAILCLES